MTEENKNEKVKKKVNIKDIQSKVYAKQKEEILKYKIPNEANIVGAFWKNPDLYFEYKVNPNHFDSNKQSNIWKVYYIIGKEIVKEGKKKITDIEVGLYLEKHPKLKKVYDYAGGYAIVEELQAYIDVKNIEGYINEFNKWWAILQLNERGWLKHDNIKEYIDYTSEDIYNLYNAQFNDIFIHTISNVKSYNLCSDLDELIEEADAGLIRGLPLYHAPMLDDMIGGWRNGEIVMLGGISGSGKSTLMIELLFPTIIEKNEKLVVILNEQDEKKMRREFLTFIMNNVLHAKFDKKRWLQGKFTDEEKEYLNKAKKWMKDKENKRNITIVPLEKYSVGLVIKIINKYSAMGVDKFILDTFKPNTESESKQMWLEMQQDSVKLYDCIKPVNNNVALWINLQLSKSTARERYLGLDSIGVAKNIVDVASTFIAIRSLWTVERERGRHEVSIIEYFNENMKSKRTFTIPEDNHINHHVIFVPKSREGGGGYQIVAENNLGYNTYNELGLAYVEESW